MKNALGISTGFAMAICIAACGGTSFDPNNVVPPASDPVCTTGTTGGTASSSNDLQKLQTPGVFVPPTTVSSGSDAGVRVHTNHLRLETGSLPASSRLIAIPGLSPQSVRSAYGVPSNLGSGAIAVVAAYHYPTALNDFNVFSTQFGLPIESSTSATASTNTAFQVVYASGTQPATNTSWSQEMAIDTQWTHAMAPNAKIYLVEAASNSLTDLMNAVKIARALPGVKQVSMSFGTNESACLYVNYDSMFVQAGVSFFAASGDTSDQKAFPALSKNVVAVGGTTLNVDALGNRASENVWSSTGAGKSAFEPRPTFQNIVGLTVLGYRGGCDISAVGDPQTGVATYCSTADSGVSGWLVFGGTSVSCPIIAGIVNATGNAYSNSQAFNTRIYANLNTSNFYDVTHGTSGTISAGRGWDYASGVGTPNGLNGF